MSYTYISLIDAYVLISYEQMAYNIQKNIYANFLWEKGKGKCIYMCQKILSFIIFKAIFSFHTKKKL